MSFSQTPAGAASTIATPRLGPRLLQRDRGRQPDIARPGDQDVERPFLGASSTSPFACVLRLTCRCRSDGNRPALTLFHEGREIMSAAMQELLAILDLEKLEHNLFRGRSPKLDWQRVFGGQTIAQALVAAQRTVEPRPPRALAARLFHAAGRHQGADRLRGRPHPRRRQLHHAARRGDPARPGDLLARSLVPGRRRRAGAPGADAARRARPRYAARPAAADGRVRRRACRQASGATGSATGRSR